MKRIILVRHGREEKLKKNVDAFSRSLTKKGVKDARQTAESIKEKISGNMFFISSPADRALETAHIYAEKLNYPPTKILIKDALYNGSKAAELLQIIRDCSDSSENVFLFGHNPYLSQFASFLLKKLKLDIPKSGVVVLELEQKSWKDIRAHSAILKYLLYPGSKAKKARAFGRPITEILYRTIMGVLDDFNHEAAESAAKSVEKHSAKMTEMFFKNPNHKNAVK